MKNERQIGAAHVSTDADVEDAAAVLLRLWSVCGVWWASLLSYT